MKRDNSKFKSRDIKTRTYGFALEIIRLIEKLPKDTTSYTIGRQLLRSGTSIGANTIEARSASSRKDFINFYTHALKSANESKFWIGLLRDSGKIGHKDIEGIFQENIEISKILASSIITLKGKRNF